MADRPIRFSLAQLFLFTALAGILITAGILLLQASGTPESWASTVAFSPNGKTLAASVYVYHRSQAGIRVVGGDASHSFYLLSVPELHVDRFLERSVHPGVISVAGTVRKMGLGQSLAFSPDGKTLATKGTENHISFWNVASGEKTRELSTPSELTGSVSWSDDGSLAASGATANYVLRSSAQGFQQLSAQERTVAVVLSRDGSKLATEDDDGKIDLWNAQTGKSQYCLENGNEPFDKVGLAISPNGQLVAGEVTVPVGSSAQKAIRVWDTATGKQRFSWDAERTALSLAFSPDGTTLAAPDRSNLHFFSLDGGKDQTILAEHWISSVAYSADGTLLALGAESGEVSLWDLKTKKMLTQISLGEKSGIASWPLLIVASVVWIALWRRASRPQSASARPNADAT